MKKFCKDCKHEVIIYAWCCGGDVEDNRVCGLATIVQTNYGDAKSTKVQQVECRNKNKNGDCPDYKRRWWKFWA